jgi:hypothetical protein
MDETTRDKERREPEAEPERGEHNRIGFYNSDEEAQHDERGSQGAGPGERPPENA